jgi:Esterase/lipase
MPSLATYGVNAFLRLVVRRALRRAPLTAEAIGGHRATLLKAAGRGRWPGAVALTETRLGPCPTERMTPDAPELAEHAVLYLHGGGYIVGAPALYRPLLGTLAERLSAPVYAPAYRLAPEHPYPAALDDAYEAYQALLAQAFGRPGSL